MKIRKHVDIKTTLEGNLDQVISDLTVLAQVYRGKNPDIDIDIEEYHDYGSSSTYPRARLYYDHAETDKEIAEREKKELETKNKREEYERQQLEHLMKKYGGK